MWRKYVTLALVFTVVMYGQTSLAQEARANRPARDWQTAKASLIPFVQAVPRYNKLRRGREELIAVQVRMGLPENLNHGYPLSFRGGSLSLSAPEGITIRYKNGKPIQTASPIPTIDTNSGFTAFLKVKVRGDMPLGDYVIQGRLEGVDRVGQSLEVSIPISVVEHDADVQKNAWNFQSVAPNKAERYFFFIVLFPVFVVGAGALLLILSVCGDSRC